MTEERRVVRSCGECTACCKTHYIEELQKPQGQWCIHCSVGVGCKIYDRRPEECRRYACEWLKGSGFESERPDKIGVVVDIMISDDRKEALIRVIEVFEGAIERPRIRQMVEFFLAKGRAVYSQPIHGAGDIELPWGVTPGPLLRKLMESL
jgi:hypothetical protein